MRVIAYLGFNVSLMLDDVELMYLDKNPKTGVQEVLARRLAAATVISLENPDNVYKLPKYRKVFDGHQMPSVKESMLLIRECAKATPENPIYIVAGVDKVQLLNKVTVAEGSSAIGLGDK